MKVSTKAIFIFISIIYSKSFQVTIKIFARWPSGLNWVYQGCQVVKSPKRSPLSKKVWVCMCGRPLFNVSAGFRSGPSPVVFCVVLQNVEADALLILLIYEL